MIVWLFDTNAISIFIIGYPLVVTVLTMFGRFFVTYALNTAFNIALEIVPTVVRGQGVAVARLLSCVAVFSSPYVVFTVIPRYFLKKCNVISMSFLNF